MSTPSIYIYIQEVGKAYESNKEQHCKNPRVWNLSTNACPSRGAEGTRHCECGGEGGRRGDGGGGDPVEQEPPLPSFVQFGVCLILHWISQNLPLEGGRLNRSFRFNSVQGDGSPLPSGARGDRGRRHVADGGRLQRRRRRRRAHEK